MNKDLRKENRNSVKKDFVVATIEKVLGNRENVTLKQSHGNDFDIKLGSRSIVRIVANKREDSNGVALFRIASDLLADIKNIEAVKGYTGCYNIEEIDRKEACFFRFNYETIGLATSSALAIFEYVDKLIRQKKEAEKKTEAEAKKTEASKKQEAKTEDKKTEAKKTDKKQEASKKTEAKKTEKKTGSKKQK